MHAKTMEGLVGASTNMTLLNTPFRVYKAACRRGDTATMERAMGYVNDFSDKIDDYQEITDKGMEEDAKEAREKEELERENAIKKRKEELEEFEKKLAEKKKADTVNISNDGLALLKNSSTFSDNSVSAETAADTPTIEPAIYTKTGEVSQSSSDSSTSISISL